MRTPAVLNFRVTVNLWAFATDSSNALWRNIGMCGNGIRMMVVGRSRLPSIAKKLQDHTFLNFKFHPAVEAYVGDDRYHHYKCNDNS